MSDETPVEVIEMMNKELSIEIFREGTQPIEIACVMLLRDDEPVGCVYYTAEYGDGCGLDMAEEVLTDMVDGGVLQANEELDITLLHVNVLGPGGPILRLVPPPEDEPTESN